MFYPCLYQNHGSYPLPNAQRNLCGRTHYVDDDTLRGFRSRILAAHVTHDGLLFSILESVSLDWEHTRRGFRFVTFDLFGNVVSRVPVDECWRTKEPARKAMWAFLNTVDAKAVNLEAMDRHRRAYLCALTDLSVKIVGAPE